jgi:hypothetical protein
MKTSFPLWLVFVLLGIPISLTSLAGPDDDPDFSPSITTAELPRLPEGARGLP